MSYWGPCSKVTARREKLSDTGCLTETPYLCLCLSLWWALAQKRTEIVLPIPAAAAMFNLSYLLSLEVATARMHSPLPRVFPRTPKSVLEKLQD